MNKLNVIYAAILKYASLEPDSNGFINATVGSRKAPIIIDGKQLVLPIPNQLKNFNSDEKMVFHPLSENILRGESEVIIKLRSCINVKLNYSIGILVNTLLNIVASPALHSKLSGDQSDLLLAVKDADEKTVTTFTSLMVKGADTKNDRLFTHIYLKRGGNVDGKRFSRVGIVSFPFYKDLIEDKIDKLRVKDKESFKQIFQYMFPDIDKTDSYNYGTSTQVAPYLDALMLTSANIASRVNDLIQIFEEHIDEPKNFVFEPDWMEYFQDLDSLQSCIRSVPTQHGNDGSISVADVVEPIQQQPQPTFQPHQQQQFQPTFQQQPNPNQQFQQPTQQAPQVLKTQRGLDFKSMMAASPAIAYGPNAMSNQIMQQRAMQNNNMNPQQMYPNQGYQQQPQFQQGSIVNINGQMVQQFMQPNGSVMYQPVQPQQPMYPNQMPMQQYPQGNPAMTSGQFNTGFGNR